MRKRTDEIVALESLFVEDVHEPDLLQVERAHQVDLGLHLLVGLSFFRRALTRVSPEFVTRQNLTALRCATVPAEREAACVVHFAKMQHVLEEPKYHPRAHILV